MTLCCLDVLTVSKPGRLGQVVGRQLMRVSTRSKDVVSVPDALYRFVIKPMMKILHILFFCEWDDIWWEMAKKVLIFWKPRNSSHGFYIVGSQAIIVPTCRTIHTQETAVASAWCTVLRRVYNVIQTNPGDGTIPQILGLLSFWRERPPTTERVSKLRYTWIHLGIALREIQHKNPDIGSLLGLGWGQITISYSIYPSLMRVV